MSLRLSRTQARKLGVVDQPPPRPGARLNSIRIDPLTEELLAQIRLSQLPEPRAEVRARELGIPDREWRYDLGWPGIGWHGKGWLLVEVQGGIWTRGAHARGGGIERDIAKLNAAQVAGHICLQVGSAHIKNGMALKWIESVLA